MGSAASIIPSQYGRRDALRKSAAGIGLLLGGHLLAIRPARAAPIRLLMLGDSITAGYGLAKNDALPAQIEALLRARGREVRVIDAGVSGDTTAGGLSRLDWALAEDPQAVIVALGGNDGLRGIEPRVTAGNVNAILDKLAARGLPVLLAGMLAPPNLGPDYGREFNALFPAIARARPGVVFYPFLLEGVAGEEALNQADRIHPNPRGAKLVAERMLPAVETLIGKIGG